MPSSFRIIRGVPAGREDILPLAARRDFLRLNEGGDGYGDNNDGAGEAKGAAGEKFARARIKAEEIVARAQAEAERIIREAHAQALAAARDLAGQAEAEGYEKGYQRGYQEGLEKAVHDGQAIREEARQVLNQAREIWQRTIENMEQEIVSLAREIAEKVLAAQLTIDPQVVLAIVKEALLLARNRQQVVLYVNPEEITLVQQNKDELLQVLSPETALHIIGDAGVERGGCRVETEDGKIEATLAERWRAVCRALQI